MKGITETVTLGEIIDWLERFNTMTDHQQRIQWADQLFTSPMYKELKSKPRSIYTPLDEAVCTLFSQVVHFIEVWKYGKRFLQSKKHQAAQAAQAQAIQAAPTSAHQATLRR